MKRIALPAVLALLLPLGIFSQDFGFGPAEVPGGPAEGEAARRGNGPAVKAGGEVSADLKVFPGDVNSPGEAWNPRWGDIFSGKLNISAAGKHAEAVINLKGELDPHLDTPFFFDEAYIRAYLGPLDVEGGLRKLTWGRADSFGPLDVVNPLDYTDLSAMADPRSVKLSRPMIHLSWNIGSFTKLEGVFVPWFKGHAYALEGRWAPAQVTGLPAAAEGYLTGVLMGLVADGRLSPQDALAMGNQARRDMASYELSGLYPKTDTLEYAQGGLRFTTTLGPADLGVQYYYGRLPRPSILIGVDPALIDAAARKVNIDKIASIDYNPYHHLGVDYAQVIAGFNLRAEAGANITGDLAGDDGRVYNPALVWSLGFDRDLVWGINLNLQGNGSIRLMDRRIGGSPLTDTEAGKGLSSTRITGVLSRKFFRDEVEFKTTALWGVEDRDFLVIPALAWSRGGVTLEIAGGVFGGDEKGELGQYRNNGYLKTRLSYRF
ncbi:MAG: hypothetical protein LBG84_03020 [Treponema sp.]|nr:hypothetical protein [Treponema sp.]